jgi:hypothetical protein
MKFRREELVSEDFHQFKMTVEWVLLKNRNFKKCSITQQISKVMGDSHSIENLWD